MITNTLHKIAKDFYAGQGYIHHHGLGKIIQLGKSRERIVETLKQVIYKQYYCLEEKEQHSLHTDPDFIGALAGIFPENHYVENNWEVTGLLDGQKIKVSKYGICLYLDIQKDTFLEEAPAVGQFIDVRFSCHFPNVSPGFYLYKGKSGGPDFEEGLSRLYCNLASKWALFFTEKLLHCLNESNIAFQFKILQALPDSQRVDNSVLYFSKKDKDKVISQLEKIYDKRYFKKAHSAFHLALYPGIGYAEEPSDNGNGKESFGTHRSGIIAGSLYEQLIAAKSKEICVESINAAFLAKGIHPQTVYREGIY
ncbi:T3SS effector HopA1 family protein [Flavobacterium humi]|uniref:Uncharacterized protein n=1 Tax=Flavobacterium humi TaxID=2562683 RepID=A0A4Z0L9J4_9FLAO|nr:T3SS effector HopA1 family protein [Flavobacterium humi]TGD59204.1 hypothetical protein E4635_04960 [Flavobacterium humi]